jgi:uncharacterized protein YxjI
MPRHKERHDQAPSEGGTRYLLREKMLSIGKDFWIEDDEGEKLFKVNAKVLRLRDTVILEDTHGKELAKLHKRLLRAHHTMAVERHGETVATVKKAIIDPVVDRFEIELAGGGSMEARGNIVGHEYQITRGGIPVANVSKRWFRVRDSYGVAVAAGQDDALVLALTVCIEHLTD